MTSNRAKTIPDDFSEVLLQTGHWSDRLYAGNRIALTQSLRRGTASKGDWHEVEWQLQLPYPNDPPNSYRLMLKAGDRRINAWLSIVEGEQSAVLLAVLKDYSGSADYIGFLERLLTTEGVQIFNLKTYCYYWKGLRGYASKQIQPGQAEQLFSPPTHFEPISWIDFEFAEWVEQNAALPSAHSDTVYQRWLPLMPPDFDPKAYRSLYDMLFYLMGDPSFLDAAEVEDGYPLHLLPMVARKAGF